MNVNVAITSDEHGRLALTPLEPTGIAPPDDRIIVTGAFHATGEFTLSAIPLGPDPDIPGCAAKLRDYLDAYLQQFAIPRQGLALHYSVALTVTPAR